MRAVTDVDIGRLASALYEPEGLGVVTIEGWMDRCERESLLERIETLELVCADEDYKEVSQRVHWKYFTPEDIPCWMRPVTNGYLDVVARVGMQAGYEAGLDSVGIHRYEPGIGITSHRDESTYINAIGILVLSGVDPFAAGRSRHELIGAPSEPGDLLLMRAPRSNEEKHLRPYHAVSPITKQRCSMGFRQLL